jgi:hypothetical protein
MNRKLRVLFSVSSAFALVFASACSSSGPGVQTLGFLDDYSLLAPGREGQASLIYIDAEADFSIYSGILIEPVVAWAGPGGEVAGSTRNLAGDLGVALRRELAREFEIFEQPRAGTLRLRTALAPAAGSHLVLEVELLDATSGQRVVAAVDQRKIDAGDSATQTNAWAILIRNRLASFRQFDAAARAREAGEGGR